MRRGTTPKLKLKINGLSNLNVLKELYVTLAQGSLKITKETADITIDNEHKQLIVSLTEEDTLSLKASPIAIQLRAVTENNEVIATTMAQITVMDILYDKPIEKGEVANE